MTEILFGGIEEYGIEVGIDENGMLYEADEVNIEYVEDTPENRAEFIEDAKNTLEIWKRERLGRIPQELWYVATNGSILTDGKKIAIIEMYTMKDGNASNDYSPEFFEVGSLAPVLAEAGWEVCVGNTPVKEVDDVDECIANARQWAKYYEPTDGEEVYADIDEIEITW